MKRRQIQWIMTLLTVALVAGIFGIVLSTRSSNRQEISAVLEHRAQIDHFMRTSSSSPFAGDAEKHFAGLSYYAPDPSYRVQAKLTLLPTQETVEVPTSHGSTEAYTKYAWASFTLNGKAQRVLLLKAAGDSSTNRLFLMFTDETSGTETYGGGRYLDIYQNSQDSVTIDFNWAYNPYCVYSDSYACPLAPAENHLTVAVDAGEKMYQEKEK